MGPTDERDICEFPGAEEVEALQDSIAEWDIREKKGKLKRSYPWCGYYLTNHVNNHL